LQSDFTAACMMFCMPLRMLSSGADFFLAGDVRKIYKTPKNFLTKRRKNSLQNAEKMTFLYLGKV